MKRIIVILLTTLLAFPLFAQENKQEEPVIVMDELMFLTRVFDYKNNEAQEWKYKGDKPCIIDFYATWCGPCKMMAPMVESLAGKYAGKVDFYKVDIDQEPELASVFGIRSIPTFLFIPVKGKPSVQMGAMQKEDFEGLIDKIKTK